MPYYTVKRGLLLTTKTKTEHFKKKNPRGKVESFPCFQKLAEKREKPHLPQSFFSPKPPDCLWDSTGLSGSSQWRPLETTSLMWGTWGAAGVHPLKTCTGSRAHYCVSLQPGPDRCSWRLPIFSKDLPQVLVTLISKSLPYLHVSLLLPTYPPPSPTLFLLWCCFLLL